MNRKALCEAFADQHPARGRASSIYYDGKVAFSYGEHFPLAIITGPKAATMNSDKYSSTTSRHQSQMRWALTQAGYDITSADTATMKQLRIEAGRHV